MFESLHLYSSQERIDGRVDFARAFASVYRMLSLNVKHLSCAPFCLLLLYLVLLASCHRALCLTVGFLPLTVLYLIRTKVMRLNYVTEVNNALTE